MQIAEETADMFNALVLKTCSHIDKEKTVTIQYFPQSEHLILDGFENKSSKSVWLSKNYQGKCEKSIYMEKKLPFFHQTLQLGTLFIPSLISHGGLAPWVNTARPNKFLTQETCPISKKQKEGLPPFFQQILCEAPKYLNPPNLLRSRLINILELNYIYVL